MELKPPKVLLECGLKYDFPPAGTGEAQVRLTDAALELMPKHGKTLTYSYRDIAQVQAQDYQIILAVEGGELRLFHLGRQYSDFVRILISQRNELILTDLLMQEKVRRAGVAAVCTELADEGEEELGNCELRLCDTALLIIPEYAEPIRLPLSYISGVSEEGYSLTVNSEAGDYRLRKMGREFTPFSELLSQAMNELAAKAQGLLRELAPAAGATAIQQAARLMGEGRAAKRGELDKIDPGIWKSLELQLDSAGIKQEYDFLSSATGSKQQCIGFKRELVAQAGKEYIWFLIPIPEKNIIAMEASSGPDSGRATYFFKIVPRLAFAKSKPQELAGQVDSLLTEINRCMLAINFRREPIYLAEEKLLLPRYQKYRLAVNKIPELQMLRERFVGRVFHREPEQWEQDVKDLLSFILAASDDKKVWAKSDLDSSEEISEDIENGG